MRAEKYPNTGTTTTILNEPAKSLRITKKAKENANKTVSNRTSKKTGISEIDLEDKFVYKGTPAVENKWRELSHEIQSLSEKVKANTEFIQRLKGMSEKVHEDQYSLFMFITGEQDVEHALSQRISLSKDDAVIPSNSIGVNRNKFDNNAILLYALLERIRGKEETLFIVAIKPSSDLKLENMSEVYYEKTLNEILEVLGIDEATTEYAYYLFLTETENYIGVLCTVLPSFNGIGKLRDDIHNRYEAVEKIRVKKILTLKSYMHEDLPKEMLSNYHRKIEESECLPKNFDTCAISRESLLSATSSNKELYKRVNEILGQNVSKIIKTKELVNYLDKNIKAIEHCLYPSKAASQIPAREQKLNHLNEQKQTRSSVGNFSSHETKYRHDRASQIPASSETSNHLNEQKRTKPSAGSFTLRRTKIRHDRATTTAYSRRREQDLYTKSLRMQTLISLEQLRESLVNVKYPHYIWPSGHPLILSKLRQIEEHDFSSSEYLERLYSFVHGINRRHHTWNSDQIVRPEPMVSAGFSYDGEDDKVVCKSCGAISDVNDWSDDDEDYAFSKHREAVNGPCEFLRIFDGEAQSTQAERSCM